MKENSLIAEISYLIEENPTDTSLLMKRAEAYMRMGMNSDALNDFIKVSSIDPDHIEAKTYITMIRSIFEFRYSQMYNA